MSARGSAVVLMLIGLCVAAFASEIRNSKPNQERPDGVSVLQASAHDVRNEVDVTN